MIKRRFATIDIGQIHYWTAGEDKRDGGRPPIVLLHASPYSARTLNVLTNAMGRSRWAIAPDHLGQGDSAPPRISNPTIEYFGDALIRLLDTLGVAKADVYGTQTGGHLAMDVSIRHPQRIRKIILDGSGPMPEAVRDAYVAQVRKKPPFDYNGSQMMWAFQTAKDMYMFFPYYERDSAHRRARDLGAAQELHLRGVELLRNHDSYSDAYVAAFFANPGGSKYPRLRHPILHTVGEMDGSAAVFDQVAKMIPNCTARRYPRGVLAGDYAAVADMFTEWLDS